MQENIQFIRRFLNNPECVSEEIMKSLDFRKFVKENENKTFMEMASEYNIEFILKSKYV